MSLRNIKYNQKLNLF